MTDRTSGLVQGGLGGPADQLLEAGQEEVFSRAEVESGRIEHNTDSNHSLARGGAERSQPETQAELSSNPGLRYLADPAPSLPRACGWLRRDEVGLSRKSHAAIRIKNAPWRRRP